MNVDGMNRAPHVLVVCRGNLCRSPLGGALLERELARAGLEAEVVTVGLDAPIGIAPDHKLHRVAAELGLDLSRHLSTPLTRQHLRWADLILTMTGEQTEQVHNLEPLTENRTTTLRAAAWKARLVGGQEMPLEAWVRLLVADVPPAERAQRDTAYDISDPIGGRLRHYRAMGDEVRDLVIDLVERWSGR